MAIITTAGENLITAQQAAGQSLVIDKIIFANINGLDHTASPSKAETKPGTGDIVATEAITQAGVVNASTVVYSMTMPSTMGTWSFNWMGLYSSAHDVVVAIAYTPLQEKRATVGEVLGNVLNKNFAIEFVGAATTTGITIDAESWQIDYTARLETMDEIQRQAIKNIYGQGVFLNDCFKVEYNGTNYILKAGQACVGGLFIELPSDQVITPGALPQSVWLDVYQQKTMAGVQNTFDVTINGGATLSDYTANGVAHSLVKLATVNAQNDIDDFRSVLSDFEAYHKGNTPTATTSQSGFAKLIDSVTSSSTILAATAKAVKTAYDKGVEALGVANSKANANHSHGAADLPNASTSAKGVSQLSDSVTSTSTILAATAKAVKTAYDKAVEALGVANGKANASHSHGASDLPNASTSAKGVSKLNSATNSSSETDAATPKAVKAAYDLAASKAAASHTHSIANVSGLQEALDSAGVNLGDSTVVWSGNTTSLDMSGFSNGLYLVRSSGIYALIYYVKDNNCANIFYSDTFEIRRIYINGNSLTVKPVYFSNNSYGIAQSINELRKVG